MYVCVWCVCACACLVCLCECMCLVCVCVCVLGVCKYTLCVMVARSEWYLYVAVSVCDECTCISVYLAYTTVNAWCVSVSVCLFMFYDISTFVELIFIYCGLFFLILAVFVLFLL